MKDITIELEGLQGDEVDEDYVRAFMAAMLHPSVEVVSLILEAGDGYSWGPREGRATIKIGVQLDDNPVLKYLLRGNHHE